MSDVIHTGLCSVIAAKVQFAANTSDSLSSLQWPCRVRVRRVALCCMSSSCHTSALSCKNKAIKTKKIL